VAQVEARADDAVVRPMDESRRHAVDVIDDSDVRQPAAARRVAEKHEIAGLGRSSQRAPRSREPMDVRDAVLARSRRQRAKIDALARVDGAGEARAIGSGPHHVSAVSDPVAKSGREQQREQHAGGNLLTRRRYTKSRAVAC
jgi:hypothetical protein